MGKIAAHIWWKVEAFFAAADTGAHSQCIITVVSKKWARGLSCWQAIKRVTVTFCSAVQLFVDLCHTTAQELCWILVLWSPRSSWKSPRSYVSKHQYTRVDTIESCVACRVILLQHATGMSHLCYKHDVQAFCNISGLWSHRRSATKSGNQHDRIGRCLGYLHANWICNILRSRILLV